MLFKVAYRAKDGKKTYISIEAADKKGCFKELERLGIRAICVSECNVSELKKANRLPLLFKVALLALCTLVGILIFFRVSSHNKPLAVKQHKQVDVNSHTDKKKNKRAETNATVIVDTIIKQESSVRHSESNSVSNATTRTPPRKFRVVRPNKGKKKLFHNIADIYISRLVNVTPGSLIIGTINYDRFPEQLKKALKKPIIISEDDTPEEIAKKKAVIETRDELKRMMESGEDVATVMKEAEAELRKMYNYQRTLHKELAKAMLSKEFSADDMQDYVDAANKMLSDNGMAPLKYPQLWVRRMRQEEILNNAEKQK